MTTEEVKTTVKKHRSSAVLGGVAGILLVGGYFAFQVIMTPAEPEIQTAPATEVIDYVINSRGLENLADIEQQRFLDRWKSRITGDDAYRTALKTGLQNLSDADRKAFTEVLFGHIKKVFVDDATQFAQLTTAGDQSQFCRRKFKELESQKAFLTDLAAVFSADFRGNKIEEWILAHTSAAERQVGEPYYDALKRVGTQLKNEARAQTPNPG